MNFITDIYLYDLFTGFSLLLAVIGGLFACYRWRRDVALKRADYINELTDKIRTDPLIVETLYLLDYGGSWYSREFHSGSAMEVKIDKTLSYFSYICYLRDQRIISDTEFKFFKYKLVKILVNWDVQDYLYNLYHYTKRLNLPLSFQCLVEYGKEYNLFDADFFDPSAHKTNPKYHRYLNF